MKQIIPIFFACDEKYVKSGPLEAETEHFLYVEKEGYESGFESFTAAADVTKTVTVTLFEKQPESGYVSVTTIPAGAGVYIDEKFCGYAPVSEIAVSPGAHSLKVACDGYTDVEETLLIGEGTSINKTVSLAAAPVATTEIPYTPVPLAGILAGIAVVCLVLRK